MTHSTYFVQECPTCGRALHIRVEYLGRKLNCQHCRGKLEAMDPDATEQSVSSISLLQRAEDLLNQSRSA